MNKLLEIKNLSLSYKINNKSLQILKNVNIDLNYKESISVIGESGSGKTSLIMLIAGLEKFNSGELIFDGNNFKNLNEDELSKIRRKNIGIIFQSFNLLPSMTTLENVNLPIEISGTFKNNKMAMELLTAVGLKNRIFHYPHQLSGGEQQRVAIARSLISNPEILIADEPTGNLDKKNSEDVIKLLFKLKKDFGSTLILVTHDTSVAKLCDRIIKIDNGLIVK